MYCHFCGQHHGGDRGMSFLAQDALAEALSLEGKTVTTLRDMFWRPGKLLNAYRLGVGSHYFSPFKLFLVMSAAFFVFVSWAHVPIYQYLPTRIGPKAEVQLIDRGIRVTGVEYGDVYLQPPPKRATLPDLEASLDRALAKADPLQAEAIGLYRGYALAFNAMNDFWATWLPRILWLLMPAYTLLLIPFFPKRPIAEHALFTIWAHCLAFAVLMAVASINMFGARLPSALLFPVYLVFFTIAAGSYYGVPRWQAALRGAGHLVVYALVLWLPALLIVSLFHVTDRVDMGRYWEAWADEGRGGERLQFPVETTPMTTGESSGGSPTVSPTDGKR